MSGHVQKNPFPKTRYVGKDAAVTHIRAIDVKEGHRVFSPIKDGPSFPHVTYVEYIVERDVVTGIRVTFKTHQLFLQIDDVVLISTHPENPYRQEPSSS